MWNLDNEKIEMRFTDKDLKGLGESEWLEVRLLNQDDTNEIDALTKITVTKIYKDPENPRIPAEAVRYEDWKGETEAEKLASKNLADEMRFCKSITGWCLYKDAKTKIPCNDENKKKLRKNGKFVAVWTEAIAKLVETLNEETEQNRKN